MYCIIDPDPGADSLNQLSPKQDNGYFADDIFKYIFFNENFHILIKIH